MVASVWRPSWVEDVGSAPVGHVGPDAVPEVVGEDQAAADCEGLKGHCWLTKACRDAKEQVWWRCRIFCAKEAVALQGESTG